MNITSVDFTLSTGGLDIYVAGCNPPHCQDCHNPELWSFDIGEPYTKVEPYIEEKINKFQSLIQNIFIFGGEPLHQPLDHLQDFLFFLHKFKLPVWLFTREDIKSIPTSIKQYCDFIKTGRYLPECKVDNYTCYGITLATSNQKIYKV